MNLADRTALSYYRPAGDIRPDHGICLVQHSLTGKFYVQKRLTVYNAEVYQALLAHPVPDTPRIFELAEDEGILTVIEEYLPGNSLQELLDEKGSLLEPQVIDIISQLLVIVSGLHHASPAIIHRDIKPSNVILTGDGIVKLLDFNAAKFVSDSKSRDTVLLGTSGFAAPEQYGFAPSGVQTDLYSIGVLMNVLLNGSLPSERLADGRLSTIIAKCTQIDPHNRYTDAEELLAALEKIPADVKEKSAAAADREQPAKNGRPIHVCRAQERPYTWKRFLPPGFRSGSAAHMIIALLGYLLLFYCGLDLTVETDSFAEVVLNRFAFCLSGLGIIFFSCNYLDVQSHLPLTRSPNRLIRTFGIILYDAVIFLGIVLLLVLAVDFFLP
ncbi:MAG: serine/threonine protein kinase [Clostridiales bacterium]|nr:serine/threonine protein kinase [Clostridiales bacterium]